ncbi:HD domain-containing protein [Desulfosporosinus lacus]|uniref:Histidine kinase-, DNA gyrase B-, and HSP90-like ATPase n=1 Tax=Desulfosporosinus lacus DSM 15449 TaxID=1121420 RepID=A0A1M6DL95_9FIRM|nr:ATP-binding protein [Desulfosporosinus lacus]SHI73829.1 Histidine kinase-, DNA gyrase B-, and HSP90-like ATPase [Desulfosporosinus lacus DSM 15449]
MKLEVRFFELSKNSKKATEIYNTWLFIKKDISNQLDNVSVYFPHFSLHDSSHSETILSQIERILGDRINDLCFSDIYLLLLVSYSHDLGMVLQYSEVEEYFRSEEYVNDLTRFSQDENNPLYRTSKRLLEVDIVKNGMKKEYIDSLKIYEDVLKIVEFHFRYNHAYRSSEKLEKYLCGKLQINRVIGIRIIRLIAKICELHQMDYNHILELPHSTNGISDDYCHPRFIAFMLCLGDLLDLDTDRFNEYYLETTTPLPNESELHKAKHESILHFLVNTSGVEIIAECEIKDVYRILQGWVEWIDDLLKFGALNWSRLVQNDFGNCPALIKREISFKNNKSWMQYNNLKFSVSQDRAVELLVGANIYRSKFVFLREIIQNAVDASLIQLWKKYQQLGEVTSIFKNNYYERLIEEFDISLKIKDVCGQVLIELRDKGTGISLEDILSISKVGNKSRNHEILNEIPEWLKPAGAFGLGLQSIFMVADEFEIITKTENEKAKKIRFESTTTGKGYIDIEDYNKPFERGSCIFVKISNEKVYYDDLYCSRFAYETESKTKLIQQHIYSIYNNKSEGRPIGISREMKLKEYVNVDWQIILEDGKKVVDERLYTTIFDENLLKIVKGKLVIEGNTLRYTYFDQDTLTICSLNFIDFYDDNKTIMFDAYDNNFNASLFYKHEFVKDEIIKERIGLSHSSQYKNFDFSVNILSGNAEKLLTIDRKGVKKESEQLVIEIVERSVMNTSKKLINDLITSKESFGSLIFKIFELAIYYDYRVEEFYSVFYDNMVQYSLGNYLSVEADINSNKYNTIIRFDELYKNEIIFVCKEIPANGDGIENKIIDLGSENRVFWLEHKSIQTPNYARQKMCVSHKILKGFLGQLKGKVYFCIKVKPFGIGNIRNDFEKDDYFVLYDFIFALINDYRVMLGNHKFPEIGVATGYSRYSKETLQYELILPEKQRMIVKDYLLGKCDEFDENAMIQEVITSHEYEKTTSYITRMNDLSIEVVNEKYILFIKELLELIKNKEKMSPYVDEFLKEINLNPRTLYQSSSKLEDVLYSNDYII